MKRKLTLALCAALLVCTLLTCAFADIDFTVPSLSDMLVKHRVFVTGETETYMEFLTVFYRDSNHALVQLNDEMIFYSSSGMDYNTLATLDYETIYPGFNSMTCADTVPAQRADGCSVAIRFYKLEDNWKQLVDNGILVAYTDGAYFDADSLCDDILSKGARELSLTEYGDYGLNYDVVE